MAGVFSVEARLRRTLAARADRGLLRSLTHADGLADFSSNDYLGLARATALADAIAEAERAERATHGRGMGMGAGSTGSRLLTGNSRLAEEIEREQDEASGGGGGRTRELAQFHAGETALLFNSGYDANYGLLSSLPAGADVVLYDELVHASVHDGMRAGRGRREAFRHNDVAHLRKILAQRRDEGRDKNGDAFVVVETVYSMDGDLAPLPALVDACEQFGAQLIVDEAHATGVFGPNGAGCVQAHGLERRVFARVHTFGKALGVHGAAVLGSDVLRSYLINYARSLIYTTSLPTHSLLSIRAAYATMAAHPEFRDRLLKLVSLFQARLRELPPGAVLASPSAIQGVVVPGNARVVHFASALRQQGFDVKPIRSPTVPAGTERVRICLHAHNTEDEILRLCAGIQRYWRDHVDLPAAAAAVAPARL